MSRLANIEKAGYYPLPIVLLELILAHLLPPERGGRILDPCAGKGVALIELARALELEAYGNELSHERAKEMRAALAELEGRALQHHDKNIQRGLNRDAMHMRITNEGVNLLYLNPPYDHDKDDGRLELSFLKRSTWWLQQGGVLVYVIPKSAMRHRDTMNYLTSWYHNISVYQFPEPEYEQFKQVVIFAYRNGAKRPVDKELVTRYQDIGKDLIPCPIVGDMLDTHIPVKEQVYQIPELRKRSSFHFTPIFIDPKDAAEEALQLGAVTLPDVQAHLNPADNSFQGFRPLMPLKKGHLAGLIAAGFLNNYVLEDEAERLLIKGRAYKEVETEVHKGEADEDTGNKKVKTVHREQVITEITTMNEFGDINHIANDDLPAFLQHWLPQLTKGVSDNYEPLYQFEGGVYADRIGDRGTLFPVQKHVAMATAMRLSKANDAFIIGEMGTGKTRTAATVIPATQAKRTLLMCPPHLWKKWIRELELVNPEANVMFINNVGDVDRWMAQDEQVKPQIGVMKFTSARSASGWVHAYDYWKPLTDEELAQVRAYDRACRHAEKNDKPMPILSPELAEKIRLARNFSRLQQRRSDLKIPTGVRCPTTGEPLTDSKGHYIFPMSIKGTSKRHYVRTKRSGVPAISRTYWNGEAVNGTNAKTRARFCPAYQDTRSGNKAGTGSFKQMVRAERIVRSQPHISFDFSERKQPKGRYPLANYIKRKYNNRIDLLIADEVHMLKAGDSDQGYAFARLISASKKVLGLTGTIYGGKASTIFHLLYRMSKEVRKAFTDESLNGKGRMQLKKWVEQFGVYEITETHEENSNGKQTGNSRSKSTVREAPGGSPAMLPWLLSRCAFMSLSDMGFALPEYEEIPIEVEMTPAMKDIYDTYIAGNLYDEMARRLVMGDQSLLGAYLQTSLCWVDAPWREDIIEEPKQKGLPIPPDVLLRVPALDDGQLYPKEFAILRRIKEEVGNGRNVLLLCQQTRTRDITPYWVKILKNAKLKPAVLNCDASRREAWIDAQHKKGVNVIIAHPKSVETGLDILHYPTVIWMGTEYSAYTVQQACRRPYRLTQKRKVKVYFYYYKETMQAIALDLISRKIAASTRVNGDVITANMMAGSGANSIEDALAKMILAGKNGADDSALDLSSAFEAINATQMETQAFIGDFELPDEPLPAVPVAPEPEIIIVDMQRESTSRVRIVTGGDGSMTLEKREPSKMERTHQELDRLVATYNPELTERERMKPLAGWVKGNAICTPNTMYLWRNLKEWLAVAKRDDVAGDPLLLDDHIHIMPEAMVRDCEDVEALRGYVNLVKGMQVDVRIHQLVSEVKFHLTLKGVTSAGNAPATPEPVKPKGSQLVFGFHKAVDFQKRKKPKKRKKSNERQLAFAF